MEAEKGVRDGGLGEREKARTVEQLKGGEHRRGENRERGLTEGARERREQGRGG